MLNGFTDIVFFDHVLQVMTESRVIWRVTHMKTERGDDWKRGMMMSMNFSTGICYVNDCLIVKLSSIECCLLIIVMCLMIPIHQQIYIR